MSTSGITGEIYLTVVFGKIRNGTNRLVVGATVETIKRKPLPARGVRISKDLNNHTSTKGRDHYLPNTIEKDLVKRVMAVAEILNDLKLKNIDSITIRTNDALLWSVASRSAIEDRYQSYYLKARLQWRYFSDPLMSQVKHFAMEFIGDDTASDSAEGRALFLAQKTLDRHRNKIATSRISATVRRNPSITRPRGTHPPSL